MVNYKLLTINKTFFKVFCFESYLLAVAFENRRVRALPELFQFDVSIKFTEWRVTLELKKKLLFYTRYLKTINSGIHFFR